MNKLHLVIDACIATSASTKEKPVSKMSRDILLAFLSTEHKLVLSTELKDLKTRYKKLLRNKVFY